MKWCVERTLLKEMVSFVSDETKNIVDVLLALIGMVGALSLWEIKGIGLD